jgi:hypothetical protein
MNKIAEIFGIVVVSLLIIISIGILMAFPTMWLWNGVLVHAVDGINEIGVWQAWGINILFGILFKSPNSNKK